MTKERSAVKSIYLPIPLIEELEKEAEEREMTFSALVVEILQGRGENG
jgi:predicted DNA-binding ribbon-helix-helix protein